MVLIITGACGFIGRHLLNEIKNTDLYSKVYTVDLQPLSLDSSYFSNERMSHEHLIWDIAVDNNYPTLNIDSNQQVDCIHLAALCKEPGYEWEEYFRVNDIGTRNVCRWVSNFNIRHIVYTSTMMVYQAGEQARYEESITAPDTAYGISKLLGERHILELTNSSNAKNAFTIRPGVVFGKGEQANYTRLVEALKRRRFAYIARKDTIKASIYVKELTHFIMWLLSAKNCSTKHEVFNFAYPDKLTIQRICHEVMDAFTIKKSYIPTVPYSLALLAGYFFEVLDATKMLRNSLHHRRVQKLYKSTDISVDKASTFGYKFSYSFAEALRDWSKEWP